MKCIIIEDQPPAQRILKKYIEDLGSLELIGTFSDPVAAMTFMKAHQVELIFLDIHLPKLSGVEFLKALPHPPHVIFTTAFSDYALQGYELDVVDYLLKPFSFQRFVKAVSKVPTQTTTAPLSDTSEAEQARPNELYIKSGHAYVRLDVRDILYINSDRDYTEIHTPEKKYLSAESLRYWLEKLDAKSFVKIHKSYIVHTAKIQKIVGNQVYLSDEIVLPIGRAYKDEFIRKFVK